MLGFKTEEFEDETGEDLFDVSLDVLSKDSIVNICEDSCDIYKGT